MCCVWAVCVAVCCRYLLRRLKRDVNVNLPTKTEQVLFCRLAPPQRETYKDFLRSREVRDVLSGEMQPFRAVGILRKICNHPDLPELRSANRPRDFGHWQRSGKMLVRELCGSSTLLRWVGVRRGFHACHGLDVRR